MRVVDEMNYYRVGADPSTGYYRLQKVIGGVERPMYANFNRANRLPQDGDVLRIVMRHDDSIYVYVNGELIIDAGDVELMDVTRFGLITASTAPRFDDLTVSSIVEGMPVSDTFSRADNAETLGTPEQGSRFPWSPVTAGPWGITAGRAHAVWSGTENCRDDRPGTESPRVRATFSTLGPEQWIIVRRAEDGSYFRFGAVPGGHLPARAHPEPRSRLDPGPAAQLSVVAAGDVVEVVQRLDGTIEGVVNGQVTHRLVDATTNIHATGVGSRPGQRGPLRQLRRRTPSALSEAGSDAPRQWSRTSAAQPGRLALPGLAGHS